MEVMYYLRFLIKAVWSGLTQSLIHLPINIQSKQRAMFKFLSLRLSHSMLQGTKWQRSTMLSTQLLNTS
jgi:hypothetical protein